MRVLLCNAFKPFTIPNEYNAPDNLVEHGLIHRSFTRRQGMFTIDQTCYSYPLHLMAHNISAETTVLDAAPCCRRLSLRENSLLVVIPVPIALVISVLTPGCAITSAAGHERIEEIAKVFALPSIIPRGKVRPSPHAPPGDVGDPESSPGVRCTRWFMGELLREAHHGPRMCPATQSNRATYRNQSLFVA